MAQEDLCSDINPNPGPTERLSNLRNPVRHPRSADRVVAAKRVVWRIGEKQELVQVANERTRLMIPFNDPCRKPKDERGAGVIAIHRIASAIRRLVGKDPFPGIDAF